MLKHVLSVLVVLIIIIGSWIGYLFWSAGQFKTIKPHFAGECKQVTGVIGAEDITIHPKSGIAYISACDRRAVNAGKPGRGGIYAYDLKAVDPILVNLTPDAGQDFQPHGISLYVDDGGQDALFVVNHEGGEHLIEIYDINNERLSHRKTLSDPMLVSPNDLVAVGPDKVYISNDHHYASGFLRSLEDYLKLRMSTVIYYDGSRFVKAASGIGYANGINAGSDGRTIYLAAVTELSLHIYDRQTATGKLVLKEKIKLGTGADNIEIDKEGGLWIGAHPKLLTFVQHAKDGSKISPSQVLNLTPRTGVGFNIEEVYLNRGEEISASSVAAVHNNRMLIGGVFDAKFLDCQR
ncbi:MAG: SMP-30/gluconolactonase/LRE family protein [Deltaproteobacteria bacterium]|nr:MAG: SMP-30/gluconolactonase/LRE family protein [Deltaproteobacteria bacterium]